MEQAVLGFGGVLFALMLGVLWKDRMGKPIVFGAAAMVGAFGMGWAFASKGASFWLIMTSSVLAVGGAMGLSTWVEIEIRRLESQGSTQAQGRKRQAKKNAAK